MTDKLQEFATVKAAIYSVGLVMITMIFGVTYYNINDRNLMSKNIDSAIAKGLDPISVRCSYVTNTDTICVAYAAAQGSPQQSKK